MNYFGEDTNDLQIRDDCCDNCQRGLSSWTLSDLCVGIDERGEFNFARDGSIVMSAIRSMELSKIAPERVRIVKLLKGEYDKMLMKLPTHGVGRGREPYYWGALIDQLMFTEYIDFVAGKTCLTLDKKGREWYDAPHPKTLKLKPIGAIFKFFKRKPSTPLENIHWTRNYEENVPIRGYIYRNAYDHSNILDLIFPECSHCG